MSTKSFYGMGQGSFYGGGMYGNGQPPVGFIEKELGPAPIVSFNDGLKNKLLKECIVNINPIQDLHGYDNPWPAGGGKNLIKPDLHQASANIVVMGQNDNTSFGTYLEAGTYTIHMTQNTEKRVSIYRREENDSTNTWSGTAPQQTFTISTTGNYRFWLYNDTGISVSDFSDVQIEKGSTATSYAPYSNICPITGWTGVKVTRCGKNLCNKIFEHSVYSISNGVKYFHEGSESRYISFGIVPVKSGTTYVISWTDDENNPCTTSTVVFYRGNVFLGYISLNNKRYFTVPENVDGIAVNLLSQNKIMNISQIDISNPQIELGSTATAYEPYQGNIYDIVFPTEAGTVYGGTLDVTSGVLTVDRAMVDMGTLNFGDSVDRFSVKISNAKSVNAWNGNSPMAICSQYRYASVQVGNGNDKVIGFYSGTLYVRDTQYETYQAFKSAMSGVQIVYELATPITYQLTPQQITTLLGTNNIWADTGDITIKYLAKK